jgi:8-oxo-dGTP pyrophosphatase MutT (NUDIX family)
MWTVEASDYALRDRWIGVRAESCRTPDGHLIAPYYTLEYPDFVHVLALTPDGGAVLTRQYRHGYRDYVLELPGGMASEGDASPGATGLRELEEETGYVVARHEVMPPHSTDPAKMTNRTHLIIGYDAVPSGRRTDDPTERIEVVVLPVGELVALVAAGRFANLAHSGMVFMGLMRAGILPLPASPG